MSICDTCKHDTRNGCSKDFSCGGHVRQCYSYEECEPFTGSMPMIKGADRPVEPFDAYDDPDQWQEVLAWEIERAEKAEAEVRELKARLERAESYQEVMRAACDSGECCVPTPYETYKKDFPIEGEQER